MNSDEFIYKAYEKLFDSKHHYDDLSWRIGAVILVFAVVLIAYIPSMKDPSYWIQLLQRFLVAAFVWLALIAWYKIYQRNRLWAEAANEAIRDLERKFGVRGAGVAFMEMALTRRVILKNINERGEKVVDAETRKAFEPHTERLEAESMHSVLEAGVWLVAFLALAACFIPSR